MVGRIAINTTSNNIIFVLGVFLAIYVFSPVPFVTPCGQIIRGSGILRILLMGAVSVTRSNGGVAINFASCDTSFFLSVVFDPSIYLTHCLS